MSKTVSKPMLMHRWSHQAALHRFAVKIYNTLIQYVPFGLKYGVGKRMRSAKPPYNILEGLTVVQIGSPHDTLKAGRSRGMYFSLFAGKSGRVFIIEPDPFSIKKLGETHKSHGITNTTLCNSGAWSEAGSITLMVDKTHPATNFMKGTVDYDAERMKDFEECEVPVDTVDAILSAQGVNKVDLVSCTTNHSETEILKGITGLIENGLQYVCIAYGPSEDNYTSLMKSMGFEFMSYDDRGVTFKRIAS